MPFIYFTGEKMKTKGQIMDDFLNFEKPIGENFKGILESQGKVILEVLLEVRDLVKEIKEK